MRFTITCGQITQINSDLIAITAKIKQQIRVSTGRLKTAEKMLNPCGKRGRFSRQNAPSSTNASLARRTSTALTVSCVGNDIEDYVPILVGSGIGAASAAASWGVVQVIAHASTGTAMAGLHGAAAANAGWAWFGGGSLAAGGGGMAIGHLILPGIGTAVAIAVSSTMSHKEANKIAVECERFLAVNLTNSSALTKVKLDLSTIRQLETKLNAEDELLAKAVCTARDKLFRFGLLSHWWRFLRLWVRGYYYKQEELSILERLDEAVMRFVSAFRKA